MITTHYQMILERGGGMITCGNHLGVMVSPQVNAKNCPPGWCFVDTETATVEIIAEAVAHCKANPPNLVKVTQHPVKRKAASCLT